MTDIRAALEDLAKRLWTRGAFEDAQTVRQAINALAAAPQGEAQAGETPRTDAQLVRDVTRLSQELVDLRHDIERQVQIGADLANEVESLRAQLAAQQAWVKWDGDYEKQFYDVALTPWDIVLGCWPNAGKMCAMDGAGREWTPEQVHAIRVCAHQGEPAAIDAALAGGEANG